ncbi:MAG TPA: NAD(P)/FAD-dependent oxidoreductase [Longimicrobiales bacterium]|nr:NAD(P)/FAD-dependent oxidoreductase [Longimicrobiales bacterium]
MTRRPADVIIVGAGPAGALTALLLARAGVDVLLLDRAAFPRAKACGDCLSMGATALLRRNGLLDRLLRAPHALLRGWRIVAPDGSAFDAHFEAGAHARVADPRTSRAISSGSDNGPELTRCALSVERAIFDALLVEAALDAGARFEQQAVTDLAYDAHGRVSGVRTRTGPIPARVTVGADGLRSVVATRLGARAPGALRKLSLTFHLPVDGVGDAGEMHVGHGVSAGVAPVDSHGMCNLTLVADAHRFGRAAAADGHAFAFAAFESLPLLRGRVPRSALRDASWLASGPFDRPVRRVAFDGAVLIGDAAGYYDPFTGQGVHQALASAELLAPSILAALDAGDPSAASFSGYVRSRARLLRGARFVQHGIDHVLRRPATANRAIARIRRAPDFARTIIAVTGDVAPVRSLFSPRILSGLLIPTAIPENTA